MMLCGKHNFVLKLKNMMDYVDLFGKYNNNNNYNSVRISIVVHVYIQ